MAQRGAGGFDKVATGVLAMLLAAGSTVARADQFGVQFADGVVDHDVKKSDLGLVWDPGLSWWRIGGFHFTLVGEVHASY